MIRLAIYFTPPQDSDFAQMAVSWLGRDTINNSFLGLPKLFSIGESRHRELTRAPFHYGFHGTIKPPFQLVPDVTIEQVAARLENFAVRQEKFVLPPLELKFMHDFFCLRPTTPCQQLDDLASKTVRYFDDFRLPAAPEELRKRRGPGLSPGQESMLSTWGYPYVMEEFRFHLTLTGRISENHEKEIVAKELEKRFPPQLCQAVPFDALSLFIEIDGAPMFTLHRVLFGTGRI